MIQANFVMDKKILVVDDEKEIRTAIQSFLANLGYTVEVVETPDEALELIGKKTFPLIITDLSMPDMDGVELCKQIRKINSDSVIYAMSGFINEFESDNFEDAGFDGHLCKPIRPEVYKRAIEGAFDKIEKNLAS